MKVYRHGRREGARGTGQTWSGRARRSSESSVLRVSSLVRLEPPLLLPSHLEDAIERGSACGSVLVSPKSSSFILPPMMSELYTATSSATYRMTNAASSARTGDPAPAPARLGHESGPHARALLAHHLGHEGGHLGLDHPWFGASAGAEPHSLSLSYTSFASCLRSSAENEPHRRDTTCCRTP